MLVECSCVCVKTAEWCHLITEGESQTRGVTCAPYSCHIPCKVSVQLGLDGAIFQSAWIGGQVSCSEFGSWLQSEHLFHSTRAAVIYDALYLSHIQVWYLGEQNGDDARWVFVNDASKEVLRHAMTTVPPPCISLLMPSTTINWQIPIVQTEKHAK